MAMGVAVSISSIDHEMPFPFLVIKLVRSRLVIVKQCDAKDVIEAHCRRIESRIAAEWTALGDNFSVSCVALLRKIYFDTTRASRAFLSSRGFLTALYISWNIVSVCTHA